MGTTRDEGHGRVLGLVILLVGGYVVALVVAVGRVAAWRMITHFDSTPGTFTIFPYRTVAAGGPVSALPTGTAHIPQTVTFSCLGRQYTARLNDLFAQTDTRAFIVIHDDKVIYEKYMNGASRDTLFTSFSMAKSVTSALIGIAIDQGRTHSVDDPVIRYLPGLKGRGFDALTIRDMLVMSTGVAYRTDENVFPLLVPFTDNARQYYTPDLRQLLLSVHASKEPIGAQFYYNEFYPLLEALILERVSTSDGLEKTNSAFNARAIDFARFGLLFLHDGFWNGRQIVSRQWVSESTTPDPGDHRPWKDNQS